MDQLLVTLSKWLCDRCHRLRLYTFVAGGLYLIAMTLMVVKISLTPVRFNFAFCDGKSYYLYIASAVVDGDLDFSNQMRQHWDDPLNPQDLEKELEIKTPRGYVWNKYPIGLSLTLLPSFLTAHGLSWVLYRFSGNLYLAPDGYSLLYQMFNVAMVLALAWGTMALLDWLMARYLRLDGLAITVAILAVWLGSNYTYYCIRYLLMVHVASTFWVTATIALVMAAARAVKDQCLSPWHLPLLTFTFSMAVVCRPTNLFILPFFIYLVVVLLQHGMPKSLLPWLPLIFLGLAPLFLQLAVWHRMYGSWIVFSYTDEPFFWTHPALLQTLFSLRKGVFLWSPLLGLGTAGAMWAVIRGGEVWSKPLLTSYLLSFLLLWYVNSAWWNWWFGWSFGNRAFLEALGLFVIGSAFVVQRGIQSSVHWRQVLLIIILACVVCNWLLMVAYDLKLVPR